MSNQDNNPNLQIFLAIMWPKKAILDECEFLIVNTAGSQQAIDTAVMLATHEVPAYVSIGPDHDRAVEIFANDALNKHDQMLAEAQAAVVAKQQLGE